VNVLDASLPSLLLQSRGLHVRGVVMAEMLADPGFDLLYGRLGSVFIPRDSGAEARRLVSAMASDLTARSAAVIFPEGRVFRPERLQRSLGRIAASDRQRARRLCGLRHVLPPRPGGVGALLDAAPQADVVLIAHVGLDCYPHFANLARDVPLHHPLRVTVWRVPRAEIPDGTPERTEWLDSQWQLVDDWIGEHL
jgi:1-acyl-sn-glycerol-3-phosphate acyltransferase